MYYKERMRTKAAASLHLNRRWCLTLWLFVLGLNGCGHSDPALETHVAEFANMPGPHASREVDILFVGNVETNIREETAGITFPNKTWKSYWHSLYSSLRTLKDSAEGQRCINYIHR